MIRSRNTYSILIALLCALSLGQCKSGTRPGAEAGSKPEAGWQDPRGFDPLELPQDSDIVPARHPRTDPIIGRQALVEVEDTPVAGDSTAVLPPGTAIVDTLNNQAYRVQLMSSRVYKEARDGQILEEGITEAGAMSSFIAAGTAYATHGVTMVPFFIYYSMFGFQRVGDLIWAAGDIHAKGFLLGGTAGRTTLAGEGLQHQDGNSHLLAYPYPTVKAYDPAFAYEMAVIVRDGLHRMYEKGEHWLYYLTVMNEFYQMPPMPRGVEDGILRGVYRFRPAENTRAKEKVHLFGSGTILREAIEAQEILQEKYKIAADVWSVTSYKELYWDAIDCERWNLLHPDHEPRVPYLSQALEKESGVFVAASDYVRALPASVAKWIPGQLVALGTDGFGRSESRAALRDFFEVDARYIVLGALQALAAQGKLKASVVKKAVSEMDIDPDKPNPLFA